MTTPTAATLTADDLLAGASVTHEVELPARLLAAGPGDGASDSSVLGRVSLRPLTLNDVRTVARAAKGDGVLTGLLMVQWALVAPALTIDQVSALPAGLVQFLLTRVNQVSGLDLAPDTLEAAVRDPLARACLVLARELGWTAAQCAELTVGQILVYLEMIGRGEADLVAVSQEGQAA